MGIDDSSTRTGAALGVGAFVRLKRGICATIEPNLQRALTAVPDAAF
ncbi:MAG: hypothetical protein AAFX92_13145 [Pseudomonadota bacterium]